MPRPKKMVKRSVVEVARKRRTCKFSRASIDNGTKCLVVYDSSRDRSTYCRDVGLEMIRLARSELDSLEDKLKNGGKV